MRFGDFLRTTVLTSAAGASALIVATLVAAGAQGDPGVVWVGSGWWLIALLLGVRSGREAGVSEAVRSLLGAARTQSSLPELAPARTCLNRLWPLMLTTILACAASARWPQVPAVAGGFLMMGTVAWRRQAAAVTAIEDRDGARFYVARTPAWHPIRLVRTPGFRAALTELETVRAPPS